MSGGMRLDFVFPRFKVLSGAERLVLELTTALAEMGHRPRIVCHQFDSSCADLLADGVELVETGIRLDWFPNRYVNAGFDYLGDAEAFSVARNAKVPTWTYIKKYR